MRRYLLGVVVAVCVVAMAAPAGAGGWWSYTRTESKYLAVGEESVVRSEAFFSTVAQAEADTQYYAYLVRGYDRALLRRAMTKADPRRWWALNDDATVIRVGRVTLAGMDSNVGRARAKIKIPRVETGRYTLMFCDAGCRRPMAHAVPTDVQIVSSAGVARFATRVARLSARLTAVQAQLAADKGEMSDEVERLTRLEVLTLRRKLNEVETGTADTAADTERLQQSVADLGDRVEFLESQQSSAPVWPWLLGGALVLAAAALALRQRGGTAPQDGSDDAPASQGWERPTVGAGSGRSPR